AVVGQLLSAASQTGCDQEASRWLEAVGYSDGLGPDCARGGEGVPGTRIGERHFHSDSYGYRLGKSALEAVGVARQRCWRYDWVLDLDIRAFFDTIPHDLLLRAVRKHTDCQWVPLYIERWLTASVQLENGALEPRERAAPQGSVISPLLANLFLHYAFDRWMAKHHPDVPFERFADDAVCHCSSGYQARRLQVELERRFAECGLALHSDKTQIVYCKDHARRGQYPNQKFDFLGSTFRPRLGITDGVRPSLPSVQAPAIEPRKPSVRRCETGSSTVALINASTSWPKYTTQSFA